MPLSLCIVGCGGYARRVMEDVSDMTDLFEFSFASRDLAKAQQYSADFGGVQSFGDYDAAASDPEIDAVYFFTPHHTHLDDIKLAARHGKHIMVEKPIARTLDEAEEMIAVADSAGVKLMVAENYRFLSPVEKIQELITDSDSFGDLRLVNMQIEGYREPSEWRQDSELTGGGVFIDGGIHYVDIMLNIGGFPEAVYAIRPPQVFGVADGEDGVVVSAKLPRNAAASINFSRATPIPSDTERQMVSFTGTKAKISFAPYDGEILIETPDSTSTVTVEPPRRGVRGMMREFHAAVTDDRKSVMDGLEGTRDLAIVLAAYESIATGEVVHPTDPAG